MPRVGLFITCVNDALFPETPKAVVTILERLGYDVDFPVAQTCCGQMHANSGYKKDAAKLADAFERIFEPYDAIVTPSGSCAAMVRDQYPHLTGNAGMATGGTGDLLTGMIAAWLAQLLDPEAACKLAVYLHGSAGDLAEADEGDVSLIAGDIAGRIGDALLELTARRRRKSAE